MFIAAVWYDFFVLTGGDGVLGERQTPQKCLI